MYCDDLIIKYILKDSLFSPLCHGVLIGSAISVKQSFALGTGLAEVDLMVKNILLPIKYDFWL